MRYCRATRLSVSVLGLAAVVVVGAAGAFARAQRPEIREIPKGTYVLLGRVLDAGTDAPVADAVVNIVGFVETFGRGSANIPQPASPDVLPRSVMTNADGYFVFRELPAGNYTLTTLALGYIGLSYPPRIVELSPGRSAPAVLRISKYAAISGRVFDEQGDPLAGVPVSALQRVLIGGRLVLHQTTSLRTLTDDRGIYRLTSLMPGSYVVGALSAPATIPASLANEIAAAASNPDAAFALRSTLMRSVRDALSGDGLRVGDSVLQRPGLAPWLSPEGRVMSYATTLFPGTHSPADATVITIGSGEDRAGVDLPLRLKPTVRVSGVLTGPDGPMRRLELRLVQPNSAYPSDGDPVGAATAFTDGTGAFTFLGVASGDYELQAAALSLEITDASKPDHPLWLVQNITIGDSDITGLAVVMKPGLRVGGRIEFRSSPGSPTRDQRGIVHLQPLGADVWRPSQARSAADGAFQTGGEPPGRYMINASATPLNPPSTTKWTLIGITRGGKPVADSIIDLDSEVSDLVITFSDKANRVSGSVTDPSGAPDVDSAIIVFPADTMLWREGIFANSWRVRRVYATSKATFEVSSLQPGQYYFAAVNAGLTNDWQDPQFLERLIAGATKVTLGDGEERTVALKTFTPRGR